MLLSQKINVNFSTKTIQNILFISSFFFHFKIFAQGPLPLNNPPFTQGKPFSNKKSEWREIPEFKTLQYPKAFIHESAHILRDFSIDSNNISKEIKKTLTAENAQVFHIPFRVNLIDYKKNETGNMLGKMYHLEGLLTWKVESQGQALIHIQNLSSDDNSDYRHLLELKNEVPKHLKKILETQSEIINSILSKSLK